MSKPLILTDIDDCVLSWITGFRQYASRKLMREVIGNPTDWSMQSWLGINHQPTIDKMVKDFNDGEAEFGLLSPIAQADKVIPQLAKDYDFVAVTCCSTEIATKQLRYQNLRNLFGHAFSELHCLGLGKSKKEVLASFKHRNPVCWVEDKPAAAHDGKVHGYNTFLMRCDHNRTHEAENPHDFVYVNDWHGIAERLG